MGVHSNDLSNILKVLKKLKRKKKWSTENMCNICCETFDKRLVIFKMVEVGTYCCLDSTFYLNHPSQRSSSSYCITRTSGAKESRKNYHMLGTKECFLDELKSLRNGRAIPTKSSVESLNPILDTEGLLRVHGTLKQAENHPVLLQRKHHITRLIITLYKLYAVPVRVCSTHESYHQYSSVISSVPMRICSTHESYPQYP